jgi:hypothetical protein
MRGRGGGSQHQAESCLWSRTPGALGLDGLPPCSALRYILSELEDHLAFAARPRVALARG